MASKHSGYRPQVRKPSARNNVEHEVTHEIPTDSLEYVVEALNIVDDDDTVKSIGDYLYKQNLMSFGARPSFLKDDGEYREGLWAEVRSLSILSVADSIVKFDKLCLSHGIDIGASPFAYSDSSPLTKMALIEDISEVMKNGVQSIGLTSAFTTLLTSCQANRNLAYDEAVFEEPAQFELGELESSPTIDNETSDIIRDEKKWLRSEYMWELGDNPARMRRKITATIAKLRNPKTRAFIDSERAQLVDSLSDVTDLRSQESGSNEVLFAGQEVDFTILPPGTDVRDYTEALVEDLSSQEKAMLDIRRVEVLEKIREFMGRERCFYVHGTPRLDGETGVRKDYIGLVIQSYDTEGKVIAEDAIAVSPLARRNAGYLFRSDVTTHNSWRGTLSSNKVAARRDGARPLKFTDITGRDKYDAYVEKALELLTCPAEQFGLDYELKYRATTQEYTLRKRVQVPMAHVALA